VDEGDTNAEKKRLAVQRDKIQKQCDSIKKKLASKDFTEKAPAEVVEKERARAADLEDQMRKVDEALKDLA
jgi:valyl-tRNA synthetase